MLEPADPRLEVIYEAPKGSKFQIYTNGPLFCIRMCNGGVPPKVVNERFTSFKAAKNALDKFFRNNPKPVPREPSKAKKVEDTTE